MQKKVSEVCYHCGQDNPKFPINFDEKDFCCAGCKSVYEILNTGKLKEFYELLFFYKSELLYTIKVLKMRLLSAFFIKFLYLIV